MIANGIVAEAIFELGERRLVNAPDSEKLSSGRLKVSDLTELTYPALQWRPVYG